MAEEFASLSDSTHLVLRGAAVAGDPFDPELAAAAAATTEASALVAVDELLQLDLVRETDVPRRFRFRHPLVRRAVYESTPVAWRLGAHERSAEALATRGALPEERAHHIERSARRGDRAALAIVREAGNSVAHRAPASAARWFAAALRLLPDNAPTEERVELLLARAGALTATGQFAESHDALLESLDLAPRESLALQTRLTTACAGVEHLLGHHEEAHARLANALNRLPDPGSPEAVALMIELAVDGFYRMEYEPMRDWATQALEAARPLGVNSLTAAAAAVLTLAVAFTGAIAEAEKQRLEAVALVDALSDAELALRLDAASNLAAAELYLDRYEEAGAHAERAMAVGLATDQASIVPFVSPVLGCVRVFRGRLAEAAELLDGAVEATRLSGNVQGLAWNLLNRSFAALAAGDVETALRTGQESVDLTRGLDQSLVSAWAGAVFAGALFEDGKSRRAHRNPCRVRRRRGAAAHPRRLESQLPRAPDALLARTRRTRRGGTGGRPRRDARRDVRAPIGQRDGSSRCSSRLARLAAIQLTQSSRRSPRLRPQTRSARQSRPQSLESFWAEHWQRPGRPSAL